MKCKYNNNLECRKECYMQDICNKDKKKKGGKK